MPELLQAPSYKIDKGHVLVVDVAALPKNQWQEKMGRKIWEDRQFTYFRKEGEEGAPVAYSRIHGRFYPVSSVLHLRYVTPEIRDQLLNDGHQQYHYHERLGLLFLKTAPNETLKIYEELARSGYKVELEVLNDRLMAH